MKKERLNEAANAEKMTEGGRFWADRTRCETMAEKARQARAGVEDGFDVGELDGRTHVVHSKSYSALIPGVLDQVAAERSGLPLEQVEVLYGDTLFPGAALAGGSQQTASIGASIIAAHRALVKELLKLAGNDSPLAGLGADEVGGLDGGSALSTMSPAGKATSRFSVARGGFVRAGQRADLNPLLAEYHVLVHLDVPEIDVIWTERAGPSCPRGRKGRRRDRHYGRWRCCRQRRVQRHGKTCARPAGHARQADVAKGHPGRAQPSG
jgi:hypothetical protein